MPEYIKRSIGILKLVTEGMAEQAKTLVSSSRRMQIHKGVHEFFKDIGKAGELYEQITPAHSAPKLARLGEAFEEMQQHPIFKKFGRGKVHLYLDKTMADIGEGAPMLRKLQKAMACSPKAVGIKSIIIPHDTVSVLTDAELKAVVAHEMGHVARLDGHPRRVFTGVLRRGGRTSEITADQMGVVFSKEPDALKSALDKLDGIQKDQLSALPEDTTLQRWVKRWFTKDSDKGNRIYPGKKDRFGIIDAVEQKMAEPEGRSHVEAELARRLEKEHRRLFAHQYNRDIPHTR